MDVAENSLYELTTAIQTMGQVLDAHIPAGIPSLVEQNNQRASNRPNLIFVYLLDQGIRKLVNWLTGNY